ncbi:MAG: hypothetical protein Kow0092_24070 [Deferrisomatales bacterium]
MTEPYILWSPFFSVGVELFDRQHRKLAGIINEFYELYTEGEGKEALYDVLNALVRYADIHFQDEERVMEEHGYPELAAHREAHEELFQGVFALNQELASGKPDVGRDILEFLHRWMRDHVLGLDREYQGFFADKVVR